MNKNMIKKILRLSIALCAFGLFLGCNEKDVVETYQPPVWGKNVYPGARWSEASPEKYGYKTNTRDTLDSYLSISSNTVTGVVVVVGGEVIYSRGDVSETSYLASVRKSILSMLYGKYVTNGTVNLQKTIGELIAGGTIPEDVGGLLPIEKQATVFDCITARSGVYHLGSNEGDDRAYAPERGSIQPGTAYLYNNWDFNVSGSIFESLTGQNIYDALGAELAIPIGMEDWNRSIQVKGGSASISSYPAYHFYLSARDMARLGYLMLRGGKWNDTQLVPAAWCKESTEAYTHVNEMIPVARRTQSFGYGYMWWVWDGPANRDAFRGAYLAQGAGGQNIAILPALDMVVAQKRDANVLTSTYSENSFIQFLRILAAQQIVPNFLVD